MSGSFAFHPELFECRGRVLEALGQAGFHWLGGFGTVDVLHDEYGLEVCGIVDEQDAGQIEGVLEELFPEWCVGRWLRDWGGSFGAGDQGWHVRACRDPDQQVSHRMRRRLEQYLGRKRGGRCWGGLGGDSGGDVGDV